jgi:hypothetical protein
VRVKAGKFPRHCWMPLKFIVSLRGACPLLAAPVLAFKLAQEGFETACVQPHATRGRPPRDAAFGNPPSLCISRWRSVASKVTGSAELSRFLAVCKGFASDHAGADRWATVVLRFAPLQATYRTLQGPDVESADSQGCEFQDLVYSRGSWSNESLVRSFLASHCTGDGNGMWDRVRTLSKFVDDLTCHGWVLFPPSAALPLDSAEVPTGVVHCRRHISGHSWQLAQLVVEDNILARVRCGIVRILPTTPGETGIPVCLSTGGQRGILLGDEAHATTRDLWEAAQAAGQGVTIGELFANVLLEPSGRVLQVPRECLWEGVTLVRSATLREANSIAEGLIELLGGAIESPSAQEHLRVMQTEVLPALFGENERLGSIGSEDEDPRHPLHGMAPPQIRKMREQRAMVRQEHLSLATVKRIGSAMSLLQVGSSQSGTLASSASNSRAVLAPSRRVRLRVIRQGHGPPRGASVVPVMSRAVPKRPRDIPPPSADPSPKRALPAESGEASDSSLSLSSLSDSDSD